MIIGFQKKHIIFSPDLLQLTFQNIKNSNIKYYQKSPVHITVNPNSNILYKKTISPYINNKLLISIEKYFRGLINRKKLKK